MLHIRSSNINHYYTVCGRPIDQVGPKWLWNCYEETNCLECCRGYTKQLEHQFATSDIQRVVLDIDFVHRQILRLEQLEKAGKQLP